MRIFENRSAEYIDVFEQWKRRKPHLQVFRDAISFDPSFCAYPYREGIIMKDATPK